jgi:hypothetical protein
VHPGTPSRGVGSLAAILPNGKVVWLRVDPSPAPAEAVAELAGRADRSAARHSQAVRSLQRDLVRLSASLARDAARLGRDRLARAGALRRRAFLARRARERKVATALRAYRARLARQIRLERDALRRLRHRDLWDAIVIASAFPLFAAYGERGRPFGVHNLTLTASLLIWLVGDEIVDALFGTAAPSDQPLRDTDIWSYLAPLGNLFAGWWLLGARQHERFIAGTTAMAVTEAATPDQNGFTPTEDPAAPGGPEIRYEFRMRVEVSGLVGEDHRLDFQGFELVPVVATINSVTLTGAVPGASVTRHSAVVQHGSLDLTVTVVGPDPRVPPATGPIPLAITSLEVAWVMDTQPPQSQA